MIIFVKLTPRKLLTGLFLLIVAMIWINFYGLRQEYNHSDQIDHRHVIVQPSSGGPTDASRHGAKRSQTTTPDFRSSSNFHNNLGYVPSGKTDPDQNPSIPHILHQTWDNPNIPRYFEKRITSWVKLHPHWEYWFWTLEDVHRLITKHYPSYVTLYETYNEDISRSDVMRYFVLHKFGGVYVDLDMQALKPLDNWTYVHECIVSEETYEHPFIVRESTGVANILNGFIACRPGHKFLNKTISSLMEFAGLYFGDYLHATGPYFLDSVLQRYRKEQGDVKVRGRDDITILPPRYFFPTYDPAESDVISGKCFSANMKRLPPGGKKTCKELEKTFYRKVPGPEAFADHHWLHAYLFDKTWKTKDTLLISRIVDNAKDLNTVL